MKLMEYKEWRNENYGECSKLQGVLSKQKGFEKLGTPVVIHNDTVYFIVGYSYCVGNVPYFKLTLKETGENGKYCKVYAHELDMDMIKYLK